MSKTSWEVGADDGASHEQRNGLIRTPEQACAEEGHLLAVDVDESLYCLRCPYVDRSPAG